MRIHVFIRLLRTNVSALVDAPGESPSRATFLTALEIEGFSRMACSRSSTERVYIGVAPTPKEPQKFFPNEFFIVYITWNENTADISASLKSEAKTRRTFAGSQEKLIITGNQSDLSLISWSDSILIDKLEGAQNHSDRLTKTFFFWTCTISKVAISMRLRSSKSVEFNIVRFLSIFYWEISWQVEPRDSAADQCQVVKIFEGFFTFLALNIVSTSPKSWLKNRNKWQQFFDKAKKKNFEENQVSLKVQRTIQKDRWMRVKWLEKKILSKRIT